MSYETTIYCNKLKIYTQNEDKTYPETFVMQNSDVEYKKFREFYGTCIYKTKDLKYQLIIRPNQVEPEVEL